MKKSTARAEYLCRTLLANFPPMQKADVVLSTSQSWWSATRDMFPELFGSEFTSVLDFVHNAQGSGSPQKIAKALLCIGISFQEAPPGYHDDIGIAGGVHEITDHWMQLISEIIISDDEQAGTIDGIECMFLHGKLDINEGRIRRAWISLRRGLSFCQLLGFHLPSKKPRESQTFQIRSQSLWKALYQGDRFLSLLLGLPYAVSDLHCSNKEYPSSMSNMQSLGGRYLSQMADIVGHIIDRNQEPPSNNTLPSTIKIEGEMTDLAASMPLGWWIDTMQSTTGVDVGSDLYRRILPQFWHHQSRTLLHLPFMLKAATDRRYEYNKIAALESARGMLNLYRRFRPSAGFSSHVCKVVDFQVFTAAMVLVLNFLATPQSATHREQEEAEQDEQLVAVVEDILHQASLATEGGVTTQAARALRMFCKKRAEPCPPGATTAKVVIPYFGTVVFGRGKSFANQSYICDGSEQPMQLPTPSSSSIDGSVPDPAGFDNFLATMPSDLNFAGYPLQPTQDGNLDGGGFANVNLDLDQDWGWFWDNTNMQ